jgi:type I restriction enzyme, S subunit
MKASWPKVRLGEVLRQRAPDVAVEPTETYRFAGVYSFGRGVFRAQARPGSEFAYQSLT